MPKRYRVSAGSYCQECDTLKEARQERKRIAAGLPEDSIISIQKWEPTEYHVPQWGEPIE